ncbi:MAG: cadmium-translocating P-type ATPase [Calditrichaeota bacterium]|nr:MAG: cadmium-translocating P-type ATPase [Calditrichota bacterium]
MKKYHLKNLDCASCAAKIERGVSQLDEVKFVSVNFATSTMTLDCADDQKALAEVQAIEPEVQIVEPNQRSGDLSKSELFENKAELLRILLTVIILLGGLLFEDQLLKSPFGIGKYLVFGIAYLISGYKVVRTAAKNIIKGKIFDEQFLMTIATLGAVAIDEMPEAVAVMLFYVVGEFFQDFAVNRSRRSVQSLLALKPEYANLKLDTEIAQVDPETVNVGQTIIVKAGERIPLDGLVIDGNSLVDTSALTGESIPTPVNPQAIVLSGMINKSGVLTVEVTKPYRESSIARILELVENAASKKAETEKFITTFARYYTPVVVFSALVLALIPPLLITGATFEDWIYRALVVLVISCPCALVISIPLGYFGGIGGAAKRGVLVKGSNYLDALTELKTVVFDKTGTLTKGEFKVSKIVTANNFTETQVLQYAAQVEANSNHPIAAAIVAEYTPKVDLSNVEDVEEIPGHGLIAKADGKTITVGNDRLLHRENIEHPVCDVEGTVIHLAVENTYAGYIVISDNIKDDAQDAIDKLNAKNIKTMMLTGDNKNAANSIARKLKIDQYYSELLPEDKLDHLERIISESQPGKVAFVGDGINDAPVLARADIGIAMGALGSDAAVETADVVLMTDNPSKVVTAVDIAHKTRKIVWQNILFAMGVKLMFIGLGVIGIATMWEAVFGDMGVALVAIFNAMRVKN